jgi:hypothetical protein
MISGPVPASPATPHAREDAGPHADPRAIVRDLRDRHRELRAERLRVSHWRRLLRARMDLAAAALAMPEPLGRAVGHALPSGAHTDLPLVLGLVDALSTGGPEGEVDRLEHLRDLDRRLEAYESAVVGALRDVADELLERLVAEAVAPDVVPRPTAGGTMGHTVPWT